MRSETAKKFLQRSEFSEVQADALAEILADQVTQSDMRELRGDFRRFEEKIEQRMSSFEEMIEQRMSSFEEMIEQRMCSFEEMIEQRMSSFEEKIEQRMSGFEEKIEQRMSGFEAKIVRRLDEFEEGSAKTLKAELRKMEARLTWRLVVLVSFLGTIMTLVGAFLD